jgi:hypothetical protein
MIEAGDATEKKRRAFAVDFIIISVLLTLSKGMGFSLFVFLDYDAKKI